MAQVIDRRTDVLPGMSREDEHEERTREASSWQAKRSNGTQAKANGKDARHSMADAKSTTRLENGQKPLSRPLAHWTALNGEKDGSQARVQQFILDTFKDPVRFVLSESAVAAPVPYAPINDPNTLAKLRREKESKREAREKRQSQLLHNADAFTGPEKVARQDDIQDNGAEAGPSQPRQDLQVSPRKKRAELFPQRISLRAPRDAAEKGAGLTNRGNTCYMNSTLQALLHLPPMAHALLMLNDVDLYGRLGGPPGGNRFDALGEMAKLAARTLSKGRQESASSPFAFINNLKSYARTLTKFRQEDAHEFLRFLLEAMQYCSVARAPKSLKPFDPLRETTLIHKIFGGKLRSRVQCQRCKHNSDTFDPMLDLSLDIRRLKSDSLSAALANFTSLDVLSGSEKYKCEKCNRPVEATKHFTIHEPPAVLTIHLKRFTLTGQKIAKPIAYSEDLVLSKQVLSEGVAPQRYKLHAIVHHHGSGPNSGHYVASVRSLSSSNRWYMMNDSSVQMLRGAPTSAPDAYMLFYVRAPGDELNNVLNGTASATTMDARARNGAKRRRVDGEDELSDRSGSGSAEGKSGRRQTSSSTNERVGQARHTPAPNSNPIPGNGNHMSSGRPLDDDDLGESIQSSRPSEDYESLVSSNAIGKQKKRKHQQGSEAKSWLAASAVGQSPSRTAERGMTSLVLSPYLASNTGKGSKSSYNGVFGINRSGSAPQNRSNDRRTLHKIGSRMKNRFGQRI